MEGDSNLFQGLDQQHKHWNPMWSLTLAMAPNWALCPQLQFVQMTYMQKGIENVYFSVVLNAITLITVHSPAGTTRIVLFTSRQTSETIFCAETDKAWSLSCCSACFGVEAKLVATEFEVPARHAPMMFGPPFVIIQFVCTVFNKQEVPENWCRMWQGPVSSDRLVAEDWWDWTDSRWSV